MNNDNNELPVGTIIPWDGHYNINNNQQYSHKFVPCDGTVLHMSDSPMDGCLLPDLNNNELYLRGNIMDHFKGGALTHKHILDFGGSWSYACSGNSAALGPDNLSTGYVSNLPASYSVIYLIKVK